MKREFSKEDPCRIYGSLLDPVVIETNQVFPTRGGKVHLLQVSP